MSNTVRRYRIEFEGNDNEGYSAYVPDLPVVLAVGDTFEELKSRIACERPTIHIGLPCSSPAVPYRGLAS